MKVWMEKEGVKYTPNSLAGKAITYAYTRWNNMMRWLEDGRLLWNNNLAENAIRPIPWDGKITSSVATTKLRPICRLSVLCWPHVRNIM